MYNLIISTPLILIARYDEAAGTLTVKLPDDLPSAFLSGEKPAGLRIVLDVRANGKMSEVTMFGKPVVALLPIVAKDIASSGKIFFK